MKGPDSQQFLKDASGPELQDLLVDFINSLSAIKALSEIDCLSVDEKTLIRLALSALIRNQDMERCSFFILDADGSLSNVTGLSIDEVPEIQTWTDQPLRFRMGEGIIGMAAESGLKQHCLNCLEDQRFAVFADQTHTPGSIICIPVFSLHSSLIGVLNVSHPYPNYFTDWHLRLLEVFTDILGQLITNRRLFQQMEQRIALRTSELERQVAETRALKDHFASMSMHDQLTGLHNRRYLYEQVEVAIAQHKRYREPFCLLMMDVDHFKTINDRFGHIFGDQVLIAVAQAFKKQVRVADILARFGGEEFVIVFANTDSEKGETLAERIRKEIKALEWNADGKLVQLTLSIGLYCLNRGCYQQDDQLDIDQIIHCADSALYAAKANGRDQVVVFSEQIPGFDAE